MASKTFPPTQPDWNNIFVLSRNTRPLRSAFFPYSSLSRALNPALCKDTNLPLPDTATTLCLSSKTDWKFQLFSSPYLAPENFYASDFDSSQWTSMPVPGMWQLEHERTSGNPPAYINVAYPFPVDPPNVPTVENETGCYIRNFSAPDGWLEDDKRVWLRFEGVDSAFHVWVNGELVGYHQGARNPAEWDITKFLKPSGANKVAVQVYQYCDGTYLEDQDQWWMNGIFRDVYLISVPSIHVIDFHVTKATLDDNYHDGIFNLSVTTSKPTTVNIKIIDHEGRTVANELETTNSTTTTFDLTIPHPFHWTAETPTLYTLLITLPSSNQTLHHKFGFRSIEIRDGILLVNNRRIVFRGVNRHEHHPEFGRSVPPAFLLRDLILMKQHNINAIRTSHQLNDPRLLQLSDRLGFWIIDEADLEAHGFEEVETQALTEEDRKTHTVGWDLRRLIYGRAGKWTADNPEWEESHVDRARNLVQRDKNHTSVVMWSLGNEAFYGRNFQAMYDYIHTVDKTRPIHYEPDWDAKTADVVSRMYASVEECIEFGEEEGFTKPFILCEFVHAMGQGPGGIKEYVDVFHKYPRCQGGFAWEWANHGIKTTTKEGVEFYAYGGDFGEKLHDGAFVMDGLVDSEHNPLPGLIEYKKAIEPVQVIGWKDGGVEIINRYDFIGLEHLEAEWSIVASDGYEFEGGDIPIPQVGPGDSAVLKGFTIPKEAANHSDTYFTIRFYFCNANESVPYGHEIATGQLPITSSPERAGSEFISTTETLIQLTQPTPTTLLITSPTQTVEFSLLQGAITSWTSVTSSTNLFTTPPLFTLFRPLTDNDRFTEGKTTPHPWLTSNLHLTTTTPIKSTYTHSATTATITTTLRLAPPSLPWSYTILQTLTITASTIHLAFTSNPSGTPPATLPRLGLTFTIPPTLSEISYFGRGPSESYPDKKSSQLHGLYRASAAEMDTVPTYEIPQECGNRSSIRWVSFSSSATDCGSTSGRGFKASFPTAKGNFRISAYSSEEVEAKTHRHELVGIEGGGREVRLDFRVGGVGTGACGPGVREEYVVKGGKVVEGEVLLEVV